MALKEPIFVEAGITVTMPIEKYDQLKNVHTDKERYARQIHEHQRNLSTLEKKIKEQEDEIADLKLQLAPKEGLTDTPKKSAKKTPAKK